MEMDSIIVSKRGFKGEDNARIISIRIKLELLEVLERLSNQSNRSRNEIINILLTEAAKFVVIQEKTYEL